MADEFESVLQESRRAAYGDPRNDYYAGKNTRLNPVPFGVTAAGSDADAHHATETEYYLIAERARHAVRNNGLVEQAVNRLVANCRIGDQDLDTDTGDLGLDRELKARWDEWAKSADDCDYEGERNFRQIAAQSFFSAIVDGDVWHLPLISGHVQTWESHHIRTPYGAKVPQLSYGVERSAGRLAAVHVANEGVRFATGRGGTYWNPVFSPMGDSYVTQRYPIRDAAGHRQVFRQAFRHRFWQSRGVSRLSPPRESMNGFERLNYAHIHSAVRRNLISYLMKSTGYTEIPLGTKAPTIPQAGPRYDESQSSGDEVKILDVEIGGEPAQVLRTPQGWTLDGWNANLPPASFFEHASLMLQVLAVNLDLPLDFLLLDGSRVNFHGGRMIFDQMLLRMRRLQADHVAALWQPVYEWKLRQWTTPGGPGYDPVLAAMGARDDITLTRTTAEHSGYQFRSPGWPYVKPLEDIQADALLVEKRLGSRKSVFAKRGIDESDAYREIVAGEVAFATQAAQAAREFVAANADLELTPGQVFQRFRDGAEGPARSELMAVQPEPAPAEQPAKGGLPNV